MKWEKHIPVQRLKPYIKYFVLSENECETEYNVFPSPGLVIGFQYKGRLSAIIDNTENKLATAGISGIAQSYKRFKNSPGIGTVLAFFTETGFIHFAAHPAHELFNLSISLDNIFSKQVLSEVEGKLTAASTGRQRIDIIEKFFISQLKEIENDKMIAEAVRLIHGSKGTIRVKELNEKLYTSQSPFEKRFKKIVGTTPKKFASIIRFNAILENIKEAKSLTGLGYENGFFDQAHFIKDFKQFTGHTPENFKRLC